MNVWSGTPPRLDGLRVLLVEGAPHVPAAAFTGRITAEDRMATLQAGFQYHVPKPVALSWLAEVVALLTLRKSEAGEDRNANGQTTKLEGEGEPLLHSN